MTMTVDTPAAYVEPEPLPDESDRYAIYVVRTEAALANVFEFGEVALRRKIAETSLDGLGSTLRTLHDEGQITSNSRVGILDRVERTWIINPYAAAKTWV